MVEPIKKSFTNDTETTALKVPPHSIEAEQAVLGGIFLDKDFSIFISISIYMLPHYSFPISCPSFLFILHPYVLFCVIYYVVFFVLY